MPVIQMFTEYCLTEKVVVVLVKRTAFYVVISFDRAEADAIFSDVVIKYQMLSVPALISSIKVPTHLPFLLPKSMSIF